MEEVKEREIEGGGEGGGYLGRQTDSQTDAEMWLLGCSHNVVLLKKADVIRAPLRYNFLKGNDMLFRSEGIALDSIF